MKKLIVIINEKKIQVDTFEELVSFLLDREKQEYMELEEDEKLKIRYEKAFINCFGRKNLIINLERIRKDNKKIDFQNIKDGILIDNDYLYVLSLMKNQIIVLLEDKNANIFCKNIKKEKLEGNYIVVNNFVNELLLQYMNQFKEQ
ncbi:MAG: hypothetical protein Q4G05_03980 [Clostridia bacterium]|nr:hypothetical protein [Clostridia bacterium]